MATSTVPISHSTVAPHVAKTVPSAGRCTKQARHAGGQHGRTDQTKSISIRLSRQTRQMMIDYI